MRNPSFLMTLAACAAAAANLEVLRSAEPDRALEIPKVSNYDGRVDRLWSGLAVSEDVEVTVE